MAWKRTFREAFCSRFKIDRNESERRLLYRALHRRSLMLAPLLARLDKRYFDLELRALRYLGDATSSEEFRSEIDAYRSEERQRSGILRRILALRLSGRRLLNLASKLGPELHT